MSDSNHQFRFSKFRSRPLNHIGASEKISSGLTPCKDAAGRYPLAEIARAWHVLQFRGDRRSTARSLGRPTVWRVSPGLRSSLTSELCWIFSLLGADTIWSLIKSGLVSRSCTHSGGRIALLQPPNSMKVQPWGQEMEPFQLSLVAHRATQGREEGVFLIYHRQCCITQHASNPYAYGLLNSSNL